MKPTFYSYVVGPLLMVMTLTFAIALEDPVAFFGDDMVTVTAEQNEQFSEIEERLGVHRSY